MFPVAEMYTVEKAIEFVADLNGNTDTLRIEALRDHATGQFVTRGYIQRDIHAPPLYDSEKGRASTLTIWAAFDIPWTNRPTANDAIRQALSLAQFNVPDKLARDLE